MKKLASILKISANFLPLLVLSGSLAGGIYCASKSEKIGKATFEELRQEQVVQDLVEKEQQTSLEKYNNSEMSYKDYHDYTKYLESEEFLKEFLDTTEEIDKEAYQDKLAAAKKIGKDGYWMFLPVGVSLLASLFLYLPCDGKPLAFEFIEDEFNNLKKYIQEDKKQKKLKKLEKEYDEYKEEVDR